MPYNVICLACTVIAIAFGSIHNLTTRRFVIYDPKIHKGIKDKLKALLRRVFCKKSSSLDDGKKDQDAKGISHHVRSDDEAFVEKSGQLKDS